MSTSSLDQLEREVSIMLACWPATDQQAAAWAQHLLGQMSSVAADPRACVRLARRCKRSPAQISSELRQLAKASDALSRPQRPGIARRFLKDVVGAA